MEPVVFAGKFLPILNLKLHWDILIVKEKIMSKIVTLITACACRRVARQNLILRRVARQSLAFRRVA